MSNEQVGEQASGEAREALVEMLAEHWCAGMAPNGAHQWECVCGQPLEMSDEAHREHVARAILTSPAWTEREGEIERLRAERDNWKAMWKDDAHARAAVAERDRLAERVRRVEALAEGPASDGYRPYAVTLDDGVHFTVLLNDLRAALGDQP